MLIIAQPKAASTSLQHAIAQNAFCQIETINDKMYFDVNSRQFPELQKIFTTEYEIDARRIFEMVIDVNKVHKRHLLPIDRHMDILDKIQMPIIILLRDVNGSIENLKKHKEKHNEIYSWEYDINALKKEYQLFYNKWLAFSKNKSYVLVIDYKNLLQDYQETMHKIFKHLNLRQRKIYNDLPKINYTGNGIKNL